MRTLSSAVLLTLATSLTAIAQPGPALPLPTGSPGGSLAPAQVGLVSLGKVSASITGDREDDPVEGPLMITVEGMRTLPLEGTLKGVLRKHARNRTVDVVAFVRRGADGPVSVRVDSVEVNAIEALPIFADSSMAPLQVVEAGTSLSLISGRIYGVHMTPGIPSGRVQLSRVRFGHPTALLADDPPVSGLLPFNPPMTGLLTADREDDPSEDTPLIHSGGKTLRVVGPLAGLLREHARNRVVTLKGTVTTEGFEAVAVEATATRTLPVFPPGSNSPASRPPVGHLQAGDSVWVTGGRVYVHQGSMGGPVGWVQAARLDFGRRAEQGLIDGLEQDDD